MSEGGRFHWPDWLIVLWNAAMYKRPAHPDEGVLYGLRPRLLLRLWRKRPGTQSPGGGAALNQTDPPPNVSEVG